VGKIGQKFNDLPVELFLALAIMVVAIFILVCINQGIFLK